MSHKETINVYCRQFARVRCRPTHTECAWTFLRGDDCSPVLPSGDQVWKTCSSLPVVTGRVLLASCSISVRLLSYFVLQVFHEGIFFLLYNVAVEIYFLIAPHKYTLRSDFKDNLFSSTLPIQIFTVLDSIAIGYITLTWYRLFLFNLLHSQWYTFICHITRAMNKRRCIHYCPSDQRTIHCSLILL